MVNSRMTMSEGGGFKIVFKRGKSRLHPAIHVVVAVAWVEVEVEVEV